MCSIAAWWRVDGLAGGGEWRKTMILVDEVNYLKSTLLLVW